jgi:catechol-2,3-dioxygenase
MLPELKLRHMGMFVWDIKTMSSFYQEVLGFVVTDAGHVRDHDVVFLSRDPHSHHQLVMETGRPPGSGPGFGLQQISFQVSSLQDLRVMHHLVSARKDVTLIQTVDHGNSWSLYFRDPEVNRVEIYLDTPWHADQPYLEPLDLSLDDKSILQSTQARLGGKPGVMPMAQWQQEMAAKLKARLGSSDLV